MSDQPRAAVTAAVILADDQVLIARRPSLDEDDRWEFPGGTMEPGESLEECLVREIQEELGLPIVVERLLTSVDHDYPEFSLTLHAYLCRLKTRIPALPSSDDVRWIRIVELGDYPLLPPDEKIAALLSSNP
jgi:mutator protein MutT